MGDLWDAVTWQNLLDKTGAVMGYADGAASAWPPEAWQQFRGRPTVTITVLADQRYPVFDAEAGNAGNAAVATAIANRFQDRAWSAGYSNQDNLPDLTANLKGKGLVWSDAQFWPRPGVYLHIADPSGNIPAGRWHPPVTPIAIQDAWYGGWDHSTTYGTYPALPAPTPTPAPPAPAPAPHPVEVTMNVPEVSEANPGPNVVVAWVASVQAILNARHSAGLAVDGRFGPATGSAVRTFQSQQGIAVDGIVGPVTADRLCNR